jgi:hypothetical protein
LGNFPSLAQGLMTSRVAPSRPITKTLFSDIGLFNITQAL